ncbi:MAG TPA: hypothetical protein VEK33_19085 [Terriglobales bacterium]|nr:hypothetical protein [Terriglobales bacterium]
MATKLERRPAEIVLQNRVFKVTEDPPQAQIPLQLLGSVLLSELPDGIAIKPLGVSLASASEEDVECWFYAFRDGYAGARVQVLEPGGPSTALVALGEAIAERQETEGDIEVTESCQPGTSKVCFLLDIAQDLPVATALIEIERVLGELNSRRSGLLAKRRESRTRS